MEEHVSRTCDELQPAAWDQTCDGHAVIDRDQRVVGAVDDEAGNGRPRA